VTGGDGADTFLFTGKSQKDVITDFDLFEGDTVVFEGVTFKGVEIHSLAEAEAAGAAQSFGPHTTIYQFDHNATLVIHD